MNQIQFDRLAVAVTFVWASVVFIALSLVQKPFSPAIAIHVASLVADSIVAAAILLGAAGLGVRLIDRLSLPSITPGERLGLGILLGLGGVSFVWLGAGILGLLTPAAAIFLTFAFLVVAFRPLRLWWQERPSLPTLPPLLSVYLFLMLGFSLLRALVPATDWDGLSYHLTVPARWIELGKVGWIGAEGPFYYPHLLETLFVPAMLLRGDSAARLLHWLFYPLTLWLVSDLTRRLLPGVAPWRPVAVAASIPMLAQLAGWAYTDVALAALTTAAVLSLLRGTQRPGAWRALAGLFAGLAFGIKYQAFIVPLSLVVLLAWYGRRAPLSAIRQAGRAGILAALVWLPWPLRNLWLTGDPLYPFGSFGRGWDPFRTAAFASAGTGIGFDPARLLALPVSLTFGIEDVSVYDGRSGPLFLGLLPLALWFLVRGRGHANERRVIGALLVVATLHALFWVAGVVGSAAVAQSRFLLPVFVLLCPVIAWGWESLASLTTPRWQPVGFLNLLVSLVLTLTAIDATLATVVEAPPAVVLGIQSRDEFLRSRLGSLWTASEQINNLSGDSRVLLLWEPRSYYLRRPSDPDIVLDEFAHRLWLADNDLVRMSADMRAEGVTHLLIYWGGVEFLKAEADPALPPALLGALSRFLTNYTRESWRAEDGSYAFYQLMPP